MKLYFENPTAHDEFISLCTENKINHSSDDSKPVITVTLDDSIDNMLFLNDHGYYEID